MRVCKKGIEIISRDHLGLPLYVKAPCFLGVFHPLTGPVIRPSKKAYVKENLKQEIVEVYVCPGSVEPNYGSQASCSSVDAIGISSA